MADDHAELEKRIRWMAQHVALEAADVDFESLTSIQQYLLMEQAALWVKFYQLYNAKHNIVEAQVDDSIFGFGEDSSDG